MDKCALQMGGVVGLEVVVVMVGGSRGGVSGGKGAGVRGGSVLPTRLIKGYRGQRGQREKGRAVCSLFFVSIQATEASFR